MWLPGLLLPLLTLSDMETPPDEEEPLILAPARISLGTLDGALLKEVENCALVSTEDGAPLCDDDDDARYPLDTIRIRARLCAHGKPGPWVNHTYTVLYTVLYSYSKADEITLCNKLLYSM